MKLTGFTMDLSRIRRSTHNMRTWIKLFLMLMIVTLLFFVILGIGGYAQSKLRGSTFSSMKGIAASVPSNFFVDLIGLEVPQLVDERESTFSGDHVFSFVFRLLTDINPNDPKTLMAREVPGMGQASAVPLKGTNQSEPPQDYGPGKDGAPVPTGSPGEVEATPTPSPTPSPPPETPSTDGKKVVLVYHTHYEESWVPELDITEADKAYDPEVNITLVGQRLVDRLEELGVGAVKYSPVYKETQPDYNWYRSYKYSRETVKEAFAAHPDIDFVFDIHRDSLPRDRTTVTIDGVDYAQIYFIIGQKNPNWEENEQFAAKIHEKLEERAPGLSKGIWGKSAHQGDAEYNQSLSSNNVLVEMGGPFNTLEESYRTADLFAEVVAELYWEAEKVDAAPADAAGD
ncbi:stage II sporulation protein P [Paenibacillus senegalensis]|uniref:stage II sporulation protein P n=1 Tax=Paenibacillus senegalensis TaxID=1465766 RepID=UPI0002891DAA|nr:stage II sporulation protein P [Paenibacillus senegalensis]